MAVGLFYLNLPRKESFNMKRTKPKGRSWLRLRTVVKIILALFLLLVN